MICFAKTHRLAFSLCALRLNVMATFLLLTLTRRLVLCLKCHWNVMCSFYMHFSHHISIPETILFPMSTLTNTSVCYLRPSIYPSAHPSSASPVQGCGDSGLSRGVCAIFTTEMDLNVIFPPAHPWLTCIYGCSLRLNKRLNLGQIVPICPIRPSIRPSAETLVLDRIRRSNSLSSPGAHQSSRKTCYSEEEATAKGSHAAF